MPNDFKVPFLKSKRNSLAVDLTLAAKSAADRANKARTISEFVDNYDVILDCFYKLSKMDGKVTSVNGNLLAEYARQESVGSPISTGFENSITRCLQKVFRV